ncbi:MAG: hypothetical protein AABY93_14400 [Bacteroidota bacterium]
MKNSIIRYLFPVIIVLFGFSCENNEAQPTETENPTANPTKNETENECIDGGGGIRGKLITLWCTPDPDPDLAVVEILSDINLGVEWINYYYGVKSPKKIENAVLAILDSAALKNGNWNEVMAYKDSIFYFTYDLNSQHVYFLCEICCPPSKDFAVIQDIVVTSFSSKSCPN